MSGTILEPGQIQTAVSRPAFLQRPEPTLFRQRAGRLRQLADGHPLAGYLLLMARLCEIQQEILEQGPETPGPDADERQRSLEHGMPPLAFDILVRDADWSPVLDALLERLTDVDSAVAAVVQQLHQADQDQRRAWAMALLDGRFDLLPAGVSPFLGAALQVVFSRWLMQLDTAAIVEATEVSLCPVCGSPPVAGVIEHRGQYNGLRYLCCSLCSVRWHYVRLKCSCCQETRQLGYLSLQQEQVEAERAPVRAESCPSCKGYLKQFYLEFDPAAEPQADDLATLALDLLLAEEGFLRNAPNLLLSPGADD